VQHELPGFIAATHGSNCHIDITGRDKLIPIGNRPSTRWNILCFHALALGHSRNLEPNSTTLPDQLDMRRNNLRGSPRLDRSQRYLHGLGS
jgi:hypothetical protein